MNNINNIIDFTCSPPPPPQHALPCAVLQPVLTSLIHTTAKLLGDMIFFLNAACIASTVMIRPPHMPLEWNYLGYDLFFLLASFLALYNSPLYHSLQLLAVVRKSSLLQSVIKSVTVNGRSLLVTALLCVVIVYLFSIVGFVWFSDDFRSVEGEDQCKTIARCLVFVLTSGIRAGGGIGDLLTQRETSTGTWLGRTFYDFAFFVVVIVCLLNIVSGMPEQLQSECGSVKMGVGGGAVTGGWKSGWGPGGGGEGSHPISFQANSWQSTPLEFSLHTPNVLRKPLQHCMSPGAPGQLWVLSFSAQATATGPGGSR